MKMRIAALTMLALLAPVGGARAGVSFTYVGEVQGPVTANSNVTVNLYLQETVTGSSSSLIASEQGLYGAGVAVVPTSGSGSTISSATANTAAEPNGFSGNSVAKVTSGGVAYISEAQNNSYNGPGASGTTTGGSVTTANGVTTTLVYLGSIVVAVGANGTSTTFTVESLHDAGSSTPDNGANGNTLTNNNFYDVDVSSGNPAYTGANGNGTPFIISPAAVPEPSSMLLCGLAAAGMGYFGYRRRSKVQAEVTQAVA